jgi:hypothetical protein
MGLAVFTNPTVVPLQVTWQNLDGSPKLGPVTVVASSVRVMRATGPGTVVEVLSASALTQIAGTSTFQYLWASPPLPTAENLLVEYTATDSQGAIGIVMETLTVFDETTNNAATLTDLGTLLDIGLGRQKLDPSTATWTLFDRGGGVLKVFDTVDDLSQPNVLDVFERRPR